MAPLEQGAHAIRLLVVDDSPTVRSIIRAMLGTEQDITIVGEAVNGVEAIDKAERLRPDLILMDIRMPRMDGFEATEQIMATCPTPIIVFSSLTRAEEARVSIAMLAVGALDVMAKPDLADPASVAECAKVLRTKVRVASGVAVVRHIKRRPLSGVNVNAGVDVPATARFDVLAIGSSTGGPAVLREILSRLPSTFPLPVLLVQHITVGFSDGFIEWLQQHIPLKLRLAQPRDRAIPGTVLMAPEGRQMTINADRSVTATSTVPVGVHLPSVDALFNSVAESFGPRAIGVILTGMGADGADGLLRIRQAGGLTIAQDQASCTVFGMPGEAVQRGAACETLPPDRISERLKELASGVKSPNGGIIV
jgi:two-component system chemotaxis response regulator CheB